MRKGQEKILEKARKASFSEEQLSLLSREDLTLKVLEDVFRVFECIGDFPPDAALEYVSSGKHKKLYTYGEEISYAEYAALPTQIRENISDVAVFKLHVKGQTGSLAEFAEWYAAEFPNLVGISMPGIAKIVSDGAFSGRGVYGNWKLDRDTLAYYAKFCDALVDEFTKTYGERVRTSILHEATVMLEEMPYASAQRYWTEIIERVKRGEVSSFEYVSALEEMVGRIFVREYAEIGTDPRSAAVAVLDEIEDSAARAREFCDHFEDIYGMHDVTLYKDDVERDAFQRILTTTLNAEVLIKIPSVVAFVTGPEGTDRTHKDTSIFISIRKFSHIKVYGDAEKGKKRSCRPCRANAKDNVMICSNGRVYCKNRNGKYAPITVRKMVQLFEHFEDIFERIASMPPVKNSYVFKDAIEDCKKATSYGLSFPPILWNDCIGKMNPNHLMHSLYKESGDVNFNNLGIAAGYAYTKTRPFVDDLSQGILYNAFTNGDITGYRIRACDNSRKRSAVATGVVSDYLLRRLVSDPSEHEEIEIRDYVNNTLRAKRKLSLRWRSISKVIQANVDAVITLQSSQIKKISIPKDSVFRTLDEHLPQSFTRITTREQIIEEGARMKHCVASYAQFVNEDYCAIHHLVYDGNDYTVEFRVKDNAYKVVQIQSKCNRGAPEEVWDYVSSLVAGLDVPKRDRKTEKKKTA